MNLGRCSEGDRVKVLKMGGSGMIRKRLMEMGILKGAEIRVVKYAPLKDPIEVEVGDSHLSLRICEADFIDVEKI